MSKRDHLYCIAAMFGYMAMWLGVIFVPLVLAGYLLSR